MFLVIRMFLKTQSVVFAVNFRSYCKTCDRRARNAQQNLSQVLTGGLTP
jgi:hypothetical protein